VGVLRLISDTGAPAARFAAKLSGINTDGKNLRKDRDGRNLRVLTVTRLASLQVLGIMNNMNAELHLYFFDARPSERQSQKVEAIRDVLKTGLWEVVDRGEGGTSPNFNLTVMIRGPFEREVHETPALSFIVQRLEDSGISPDVRYATGAIISDFLPFQQQGHVGDMTITLPGGKIVQTSFTEISFDYSYVVRQDATASEVTTLTRLQRLEYQADLRFKFASIDDLRGRYISDASEEYKTFFSELPLGWFVEQKSFKIQTRLGGISNAWALSREQLIAAAVEHETGLEILILIPLGVAVVGGVASMMVYDCIRWAHTRWRDQRKALSARGADKAPTLLEIERIRRNAKGEIQGSEVLKIRSPVEDTVLQEAIERILSSSVSP
jgi:hypothetical protein